jgi:hypothetical protein
MGEEAFMSTFLAHYLVLMFTIVGFSAGIVFCGWLIWVFIGIPIHFVVKRVLRIIFP